MSFLDSLASGLRYSGGVLNPDVQRQQATELLQQKAQEATQRNIMAQQLMTALETGAIPPDKIPQAQATLKQIGYADVGTGPNAATQKHQADVTNEANYRRGLEALGPNPNMEAMANLGVKHGKPEMATAFYKANEDRAARRDALETTLQQRQDQFETALDTKVDLATKAGANAKDIALMRAEASRQHDERMISARQQLAALNASLKAQDLGTEGLSPAAKKAAAARYNIDGSLPALGYGKDAKKGRDEILNMAAEMAGQKSPEQQRVDQISGRATSGALLQLSKQEAQVAAFERNFTKNADIALETSTKVDHTGVPIVNKWINAGKRSVTGDPELSAYDLVIKGTVNEYSKIISGSMGNTALAEGEIKKVESLLSSAQTPAQVKAVITMMKRETANRLKGFTEQKEVMRKSLAGSSEAPSSSGTPPPPPGFTVVKP